MAVPWLLAVDMCLFMTLIFVMFITQPRVPAVFLVPF